MSNENEIQVDYGLRLYRDVFKLEALHFGVWEAGDALTLENLRAAQRRYTERLVAMLPEGTRTILDAGCGTGATAAILAERGYEVECLTPDAYQIQVFRELRGEGIPLHQSKIQDFAPGKTYDVVLMSESGQYVPTQAIFASARRLAPGGHLLMSDYFRLEETPYYKTCHVLGDFRKAADEAGFEVLGEVDVTEATLPTLDLGRQVYKETVLPLLEIGAGLLDQKAPRLKKLATIFFKKRLAKLNWYLYDKTEEKVDAALFREKMRYLFLLYRVPAAEAGGREAA